MTTFFDVAKLLIMVTAMVYILEIFVLRKIIVEHGLKEELDKTNGFLHIETALVMTIWTFMICSFVDMFLTNISAFGGAILGFVSGIIIGTVLVYIVSKYAEKRVRK